MSSKLKELQLILAEHKVYDAWQYVNSLHLYLGYMRLSYEIIKAVDEHRKEAMAELNDMLFEMAVETGSASVNERDLDTSIKIGECKINDVILQQKNTIEFFHYARLSIDILFQIVNAALLGDDAISIEDTMLIKNVLKKIKNKAEFKHIFDLLNDNYDNDDFKYIQAVDNYIKHIKSILITITNNFLFDNDSTFKINRFVYKGIAYEEREALTQIENIYVYVFDLVEDIFTELLVAIPLVSNNTSHIQELKLYIQMYEADKKVTIEYAAFFIDVEDLSELTNEIKVLPLAIKPNKEIYSFDMQFDKIFIRKKGTKEILGCATLKNGLDTNEVYRTYEVSSAQEIDYINYLIEFKNRCETLNVNAYALQECTILRHS